MVAAHLARLQNLWLGSTVLLGLWTGSGLAQPAPLDPPAGAADALQQVVPRPVDRLAPQPPVDPPAPALETSPASPVPIAPGGNVPFAIDRIEVRGNTVLQAEIEALVRTYEAQRILTLSDLLDLRSQITRLYLEHDYITSGAFLPSGQSLSDGDVEIQIVEGQLEAIGLCLLSPAAARQINQQPGGVDLPQTPQDCGSARLRESYVRNRLARLMQVPVNQQQIEAALQLLQLNPLIARVDARLMSGSTSGRSILQVQVQEASPFSLSIGGDNYQSPSIGAEQFSVSASYANLLGVGDRLSAGYGISDGLDRFSVGYAIPVNPQNGTLGVSYSNDQAEIVDDEFENFQIRSQSETVSIQFRQPIAQTPASEVGLGIGLDWRRSTSFLNGQPFSFSEGPVAGRSNVTVIRLTQDWFDRDIDTVVAVRSQFSLGIDALGATVNETGADGRFFAWLGQVQWVQQLSPRWVLVTQVNAQLTPDSLLALERFGYGGVDTLRGYRQNQLVTDNGILGSIEARFALLPPNRLQLISFAEAGTGWNNQTPDPQTPTLASVGIGVRWLITPDLSVRVDYGVPLIAIENAGNSLQDNGFYFSLRYEPF